MRNIKKLSSLTLAAVLLLGVLGLSFFAYRQKIQADTIVPGFATAHLNIKVTVPAPQEMKIKATFLPQSYSKNYYFKEREFTIAGAGLNTIEWYIRKIPAGSYKIIVESDRELKGSPIYATLTSDKVNDLNPFELFIGNPIQIEVPQEEEEANDPAQILPEINSESTPAPEPNSALETPADPSPEAYDFDPDDSPPVPESEEAI